MVLAWLVGDRRSVDARILPSGSIAVGCSTQGINAFLLSTFPVAIAMNSWVKDMNGWLVMGTNRKMLNSNDSSV